MFQKMSAPGATGSAVIASARAGRDGEVLEVPEVPLCGVLRGLPSNRSVRTDGRLIVTESAAGSLRGAGRRNPCGL